MNDGGTPASLTTEVSWEDNRDAVVWVGIFPLHHYWPLLAPFFGDALLPPQRRMEGDVVAWTWRPVSGAPTSEELGALRRRLASELEALTDRVDEGASRADLATLAAEMRRVVAGWTELSDGEFSRYVARTAAGLRLHSWSATAAPEPRDPATGAELEEKAEGGERRATSTRPGHRARWIALALLAVTALGCWIYWQRPKSGPSEPTGEAPRDAPANAPANEGPAGLAPSVASGTPTGGESLAGGNSIAPDQVLAARPTSVAVSAGGSDVASAPAGGPAGARPAAVIPSGASATGSAGGGGDLSTPVMMLPQMTLQVGPSSVGPSVPTASGLGSDKGSVPPAESGTGPSADQSPSAGGGGLPGSKGGGEGENGSIAPSGAASPHSPSTGARPAAASNSKAAAPAGATSPSAAPSASGTSPSATPRGPADKSGDSNAVGNSPAASSPAEGKADPEKAAGAGANPSGDAGAAAPDTKKVDTDERAARRRSAKAGEGDDSEAGDGTGVGRPGGSDQAEAAGTPLPRDASARDSLISSDLTGRAPLALSMISLRFAPWRAEMLSDRILPTLPVAEGAGSASPSAERDRELAEARGRLQTLRESLTLVVAFRVTFADGREEVVHLTGPDYERRSADGRLLVSISACADGRVRIGSAPGVTVAAQLTGETRGPTAAGQIYWQTRKGDALPLHWTVRSTPFEHTLIVPLVAATGARSAPDPTDVPVALTDSDSGWSFTTLLSVRAGQ